MMVDTGAGGSLMSSPHVGLLRLKPMPLPPFTISGLGGSRSVHLVRADTLRVGTLTFQSTLFMVPDESKLRIISDSPDTLGMDVLAGFDLDFDVLNRRLVFYRTGELCASHVLMSQPVYGVPEISDAAPIRPIVTASIRGQTFRALLDTGSPGSIMFQAAAERLGLRAGTLAGEPHARLKGVGLNPVDTVQHLSEPISVGGLTIAGMRINVSPGIDPALDLVLGMDFLSNVHLWISNSAREVVMQVPARPSLAPH